MQTNTQMLHLRIAAEALRMHHALRQAKAAAIADGGTVECAIHDEITITVPTDSHARRILEEAAAHKALVKRQDIAASDAFRGAMAAGLGLDEAKKRAAKARRTTV